MSPSANMFFARSASRAVTPSMSFNAPTVIEVSCTACTCQPSSDPSSSGLVSYPAFFRLRSVNASVSTISVPPFGRSCRFVFSAAGFMATSTSGWSPGVRMSWSAKCSWKPDTPGSEPAGARISAGKSGNVARSLPESAVSEVKRPPVSCMPSPESPAKRMTTDSSCSTGFATNPATLAPCSGSSVVAAYARSERREAVETQVRQRQEAAERDHEPGQRRVAERVSEPWPRDRPDVVRALQRVPAVQPHDAPEIHADARQEQRREHDRPAEQGAARTRDDELHEQQRTETQREPGQGERGDDDRVVQPVVLPEVDEVGQHVRRVGQEEKPHGADREQLEERPPLPVRQHEQDREQHRDPCEREIPDEVAVARGAELVLAHGQQEDAPRRRREQRGRREQHAGAHGPRVALRRR